MTALSSKITSNFAIEEFKTIPDLRLVLMLQVTRDLLKKPMNIVTNNINTAGYYTDEKCEQATLFQVNEFIPVYGKMFKHNPDLFTLERWSNSDASIKCAMTALAQCGFDEGLHNDNPFGKYYNMNNLPWCSMFLHWCWQVNGIIKKPAYLFASSRKTYEALLIKKHIFTAATGDGMFWGINNDVNAGHTAMCLYNDYKNETVYTIEGNSGNSVSVRKYKYSALTTMSRTFLGVAAPAAFVKNENMLRNILEFTKNENTR